MLCAPGEKAWMLLRDGGQSYGEAVHLWVRKTKLCLSASVTCAHESRHLAEKLSFAFRMEEEEAEEEVGRGGGG